MQYKDRGMNGGIENCIRKRYGQPMRRFPKDPEMYNCVSGMDVNKRCEDSQLGSDLLQQLQIFLEAYCDAHEEVHTVVELFARRTIKHRLVVSMRLSIIVVV